MTDPKALVAGPKALVVGIEGPVLNERERALFCQNPVAGFILFQRNCASREQLRALTGELRALYPDRWVPVLIDHEGGRVSRLKPPEWEPRVAAQRLGDLDHETREKAVRNWAGLLASDLLDVGIDVNCVPVLDVLREETTVAIGDRAFSAEPAKVASLGRITIEAMLEAGVCPVIKHLPGHGRAEIDTHKALPRLKASFGELAACDFLPFGICAKLSPFAMTAHIVFEALDPECAATQSQSVIRDIIRNHIGFSGILFSDDVNMEALKGRVEDRAQLAIEAGCDLALHCSGDFDELCAVIKKAPLMPDDRFLLLQASRPEKSGLRPDTDCMKKQLLAALG